MRYPEDYIDKILCGDCLDVLQGIPDESIQMCMTSPPYYGLRDYGIEQIFGGRSNCKHEWVTHIQKPKGGQAGKKAKVNANKNDFANMRDHNVASNACLKCGAWKGQLGLEPTPEEYIEHMTAVFHEVKRTLRKDGTLWLNMSDSYKDKNLCMIPEKLAIALVEGIESPFIKDRSLRSWLAALIDGEGSVIIRKVNQGKKYQNSYGIVLDIKMTNQEIVERCKEITGLGCINEWSDKRNPNYRQMYLWRAYGGSAAKILRDIFPFLIVKKKQALIAHTLQINIEKYSSGQHRKVPLKDVEYRKNLKALMSQINQHPKTKLPDYVTKDIPSYRIGGGWILRNKIIWYKPNAMPSSVTDRFSNKWEYVFLFSRSQKYYFDLDAVREKTTWNGVQFGNAGKKFKEAGMISDHKMEDNPVGKNPGDHWTIPTCPFPGAHFAVFPEKLVEAPIKAGCPENVCKKCGKARERIVEKHDTGRTQKAPDYWDTDPGSRLSIHRKGREKGKLGIPILENKTIGWTDCGCNAGFEPGIVLDPFAGAGITLYVAKEMRRRFIGIDIKPEYVDMANKRLAQGVL